MKIYTNTFDLAQPTTKKFWVAPYSDCKIGVKLVRNGEAVADEFTLKVGDTTLTPDEDTVDGFTTFTVNSDATGSKVYTIEVAGQTETLTLVQITTDSTVFDIDLQAPAGTATQQWVENYVSAQTSAFVTDTEMGTAISTATSAFVSATDVSSAISAATSTLASTGYVDAAVSNKVVNLGDVAGIMKITQSDYDALVSASTVNPSTLYIIVD